MRWIPALIVILGLGMISTPAHAGKRVDWSQYLEKPGDRPPRKTTSRTQAAPRTPTKAKVTKRRSAKSSAKAKRKGRAHKRR